MRDFNVFLNGLSAVSIKAVKFELNSAGDYEFFNEKNELSSIAPSGSIVKEIIK